MKHKKTILIGIIAFLLGILVAFLILLHVRNVRAEREKQEASYMAEVVIKGVELQIPDQYMGVVRDSQFVYSDTRTFNMLIKIIDGNFDEEEVSIGEDVITLKPLTEIGIGGAAYRYVVFDIEGEVLMVVLKKIDESRMFEVFINCEEVTRIHPQFSEELERYYEELVLIADSVLCSAKITDKPDTPEGKQYIGKAINDIVSEEIESEMSQEDASDILLSGASGEEMVSYQVEDYFYLIEKEKSSHGCSLNQYQKVDQDITATVIIQEKDSENLDAKTLITSGAEFWGDSNQDIQQIEVEGRTFYYYAYSREYDPLEEKVVRYYFEAATDLRNGGVYRVSGSGKDVSVLDAETYGKFMTIEE